VNAQDVGKRVERIDRFIIKTPEKSALKN
jgi:hypothetical protein